MLETTHAEAFVGDYPSADKTAHMLMMDAVAKIPGDDGFTDGLSDLHEATRRPDYDAEVAYQTVVAAGGFLAMCGNKVGARRLHHAGIALLASNPGVLDTGPAAQLAETLSSMPTRKATA